MDKKPDNPYTIHTAGPKDKAELVVLACRNCGGSLEMVDNTHAVCPYCGQKYLIDEAKGTIIDIHVDYGDNAEVRRAVNQTRRTLIIFLVVAVLVTLIIFGFNIAARKSVFSSSDTDIPVDANGQLLVIFCQDVFGKDYKEITEEEFASIKYIKCTYVREGAESFNAIKYSFTDYQDCATEEAFQETVKQWYYRTKQVNWPSDYSKFTGLTRIDTTDAVWLSLLSFSEDNQISYVDTDNNLDTVTEILNPETIKVLHIGIMAHTLDQIEQYQNLEELEVSTTLRNDEVDISGIKACRKLKRLRLNCAEHYKGMKELGELPELTSLHLDNMTLADLNFLKSLPQLEELEVDAGEEPDLSWISSLPNLKRLYLLDEKYIPPEEILRLKEAKGLTELKIAINETEGLAPLSQLQSLKVLELHMAIREYGDYHQLPVDVSALAELTNLEELVLDNFWSGEVMGVEPLLNLPSLKRFQLGRGIANDMEPLLDFSALADNPSIEELCLQDCHPKAADTKEAVDFSFLAHYPNLKRLYLDDSDLVDISFIAQLADLRVCSLQENEIQDYSALTFCRKLESVYVDKDAVGKLHLPEEVVVVTEPYYMVD